MNTSKSRLKHIIIEEIGNVLNEMTVIEKRLTPREKCDTAYGDDWDTLDQRDRIACLEDPEGHLEGDDPPDDVGEPVEPQRSQPVRRGQEGRPGKREVSGVDPDRGEMRNSTPRERRVHNRGMADSYGDAFSAQPAGKHMRGARAQGWADWADDEKSALGTFTVSGEKPFFDTKSLGKRLGKLGKSVKKKEDKQFDRMRKRIMRIARLPGQDRRFAWSRVEKYKKMPAGPARRNKMKALNNLLKADLDRSPRAPGAVRSRSRRGAPGVLPPGGISPSAKPTPKVTSGAKKPPLMKGYAKILKNKNHPKYAKALQQRSDRREWVRGNKAAMRRLRSAAPEVGERTPLKQFAKIDPVPREKFLKTANPEALERDRKALERIKKQGAGLGLDESGSNKNEFNLDDLRMLMYEVIQEFHEEQDPESIDPEGMEIFQIDDEGNIIKNSDEE